MEARLEQYSLEGFLICEFVPHATGPGSEFLLGLRHTREFGPVVTLGPGGVHAEFLARALREGESLAVFSPEICRERTLEDTLARFAPARLALEPQRGQSPLLDREALLDAVRRMLALARMPGAAALAEFEVNPLVVSERPAGGAGRARILRARARVARHAAPGAPHPRPARAALDRDRWACRRSRMNPGRIILRNVLREGFAPPP